MTRDELQRRAQEEWDAMPAEQKAACRAAGFPGPTIESDRRPVRRNGEDHDPFATIATPDLPTRVGRKYEDAETAVLRVLQILCDSEHQSLAIQAELLLAHINRSDVRSQAEIARKYGLTRAAINKRMRDIRRNRHLSGLELYFFGGRKEVSDRCRQRAIDDHRRRKNEKKLWKQTHNSQLSKHLANW